MKKKHEFFEPLKQDTYKEFCNKLAPVSYDLGKSLAADQDLSDAEYVDKKEFKKITTNFFKNFTLPENYEKKHASPDEVLHGNIVIGENHYDILPRRFLIENMKNLKELGYDTLYLEHIYYDDQMLWDNFFKTGILPEKLIFQLGVINANLSSPLENINEKKYKNYYKENWARYDYTALVMAAQEAGIRVVAIDTESIYKSQSSKRSNPERTPFLNYVAYKIIEKEENEKKGSGKWISLVGETHVKQFRAVRGIAELLGAYSMHISDDLSEKDKNFKIDVNKTVKRGSSEENLVMDINIVIRGKPDSPAPQLEDIKKSASLQL